MHPKYILKEAEDQTGWDDESKLNVCLDFIEQMNRVQPDFAAYVQSRVDEELDSAPDEENN